MEQWVKIKQIEKDGYYVSDQGRVKIIKHGKEVIKLGTIGPSGYLVICHTFKKAPIRVHQLVLESFTRRPKWAECINHLNGIKTDNRLVNLEWTTRKGNNQHAFKFGLNKNVGQNHHCAIPVKLVHKIYELKKQGKRQCEIFKELGLSRRRVQSIYTGKDWKHEYKKFFT